MEPWRMREETQSFIIAGALALVFFVLFALSYASQKADCLSEGGKWIQGVAGGSATYFCIPK
jgi:hypothetical protein